MSTPREHLEQTHLATWLSSALPFGTWTTTANGFLRSSAARKAAAQQGVLFGLPDVIIFLQPPCWIELKRQDGTRSDVEPRQRLVQQQLTDVCGMPGIVAFGADEAIEYVRARYGLTQTPPQSSVDARIRELVRRRRPRHNTR